MQNSMLNDSEQLELLKTVLKQKKSILVRANASEVLNQINTCRSLARLVLIDPPYNRRTKFHHYNDSVDRNNWQKTIEEHCLKLRNLLTPDGSLWMHIDDSEMSAARVILDSIFGPANFVATIVWQKTVSRDNRTPVSTTHEYLLVYAKNKSEWHRFRNKLPATKEQLDRYKNPDNGSSWSMDIK